MPHVLPKKPTTGGGPPPSSLRKSEISASVIRWLLAGDPAIAWQVHQDLLGAPKAVVTRIRKRVPLEGWGARLLTIGA
jgi:hypothetical protein